MKALVFLLLLVAMPAFGASIPSAITGDYHGFKYDCRFEAGTHEISQFHRALTLRCTLPNSKQTTALALVLGCPNEWTILPLNEWGGVASEAQKGSTLYSYVNPLGEPVYVIANPGDSSKAPSNWLRITGYNLGTYVDVKVGSFDALVAGGGASYRFEMHQVTDLFPPLSYYPECYNTPRIKPYKK